MQPFEEAANLISPGCVLGAGRKIMLSLCCMILLGHDMTDATFMRRVQQRTTMLKLQVTVGKQLLPASSMEYHWLAVTPPDASIASIFIGSASSGGQSHLHASCPALDSSQTAISAAAFPRNLSLSFPVRSLRKQASCRHSSGTYSRQFARKAGQWLQLVSQT